MLWEECPRGSEFAEEVVVAREREEQQQSQVSAHLVVVVDLFDGQPLHEGVIQSEKSCERENRQSHLGAIFWVSLWRWNRSLSE
jgi:hypothetical protein